MTRREFLGLALGAGAGAAVSWPFLLEPHRPVVERIDAVIPGLPAGLDGLKVGVLSDMHRGPHVSDEDIRRAAGLLAAETPEAVFLLGDYASRHPEYIEPCIAALDELRPRLGTYAVLGNHEYWTDPGLAREVLESRGIEVLVNRTVEIARQGESCFIVGLDSVWTRRADPDKALRDAPPDAPKILLVHEPDYADSLADLDTWLPLQISGHSHGGQVVLPFYGPPVLPWMGRVYPAGMYRVGRAPDRLLYTTRGVGMTVPVRFNCPPEVTVLTLRASRP